MNFVGNVKIYVKTVSFSHLILSCNPKIKFPSEFDLISIVKSLIYYLQLLQTPNRNLIKAPEQPFRLPQANL